MKRPWSVQDAKAHLSEILREARKGRPQRIGTREACVVVSEEAWRAVSGSALGQWLVESAPRGTALELPPRGDTRPEPFGDDES